MSVRGLFPSRPRPMLAFGAGPVSVSVVRSTSDINRCLALRRKVFVEEFDVAPAVEFDAADAFDDGSMLHFLATDSSGSDVGTCRISLLNGAMPRLGRFCVVPSARRSGVGTSLAQKVADEVAAVPGPLYCHAKRDSQAFYERVGWTAEGGGFEEAGVPHVSMVFRRPPVGLSLDAASRGKGHVCMRTHDIERARKFYSLLGYVDRSRFVVSDCRAAWIVSPYIDLMIELIEVTAFPSSVVQKDANEELFSRDVGMYHMSLDVTRACLSLEGLLKSWNRDSVTRFRKTLPLLMKPEKSIVAGSYVETAMMRDPDGNVIELLRDVLDGKPNLSDGGLGSAESDLFQWDDEGVSREEMFGRSK